jgi:hypothetical protein
MNNNDSRLTWRICLLLISLTVTPLTAVADEHGWEYEGAVYLWGAGIGGTTVTGDDIDISFSDLISNLDMAFMGAFVARKNDWGLFADLIYLNVSEDIKTTGNIINRPVKLKTNVVLKGFITTLGGSYRVLENDTTALSLLAGARYLKLETDLKFDIGQGAIKKKVSDSGSVWDGVVGIRGQTDLNEQWYLTYYADVGAGESDLTWQILAGVNYRFASVDAALGYRYLEWDFNDNDIFDDLNLSGPYLGVRFQF